MESMKHLISRIITDEQYAPQVDSVYIRTFEPGYRMNCAHSHDSVEVICVIHGTSFMEINDQYVKIKKNECLLLFPNVRHNFYLDGRESCRLINIHFKPGTLSEFFSANDFQQTLRFLYELKTHTMSYLRLIDNTLIRDVSEHIIRQTENGNEYSEVLLRLYFCELFIYLSKIMKDEYNLLTKPVSRYTGRALEYIQNFYGEGITVKLVADYAGISPRHLSRLFLQELRMNVQDCINALRIKKSKELLESTDMHITHIAHALGFSSSQYYTTCFKKHENITPKKFREFVHVSKSNNIQ